MRRSAQLQPWLSEEEMLVWLREAPDRSSYQRRLAVWLTWTKVLHAKAVAQMLRVSKQAVWLWVGQKKMGKKDGAEDGAALKRLNLF